MGGTARFLRERGAPRHPDLPPREPAGRVRPCAESRREPPGRAGNCDSLLGARLGAPLQWPSSSHTRPCCSRRASNGSRWIRARSSSTARSAARATPRRSSRAARPDGRLIGLDRDAARARRRAAAARRGTASACSSSTRRSATCARCSTSSASTASTACCSTSASRRTSSTRPRAASASAPTPPNSTPLDMRMDASAGPDAAELLRRASAEQLEDWLRRYADLRGARRLARALVAARERAPLRTAADLVRVIREARVGGGRRHNPATLVFQALRIATNDELGALAEGLDAAIDALRPGGRLVVIAYHSAEDRIVKNGLRDAARGCTCPPHVPVCVCGGRVRLRVLTRRPISPGAAEISRNPALALRAAARRRARGGGGMSATHPAHGTRAIWSAATSRACARCARGSSARRIVVAGRDRVRVRARARGAADRHPARALRARRGDPRGEGARAAAAAADRRARGAAPSVAARRASRASAASRRPSA